MESAGCAALSARRKGIAMTASPSQFGAMTRREKLSAFSFQLSASARGQVHPRAGYIKSDITSYGGQMAESCKLTADSSFRPRPPPVVHPEPCLRLPPHGGFRHLRIARGRPAHALRAVG